MKTRIIWFALCIFCLGWTFNSFAASFSSTQNGNWNVAATWGGAGIPGDGDDVTISHDVTITVNQIIGTGSGSAISINNSGTLSVNQNIILTCRGSIFASGNIIMAAGAELEMDTGSPSEIQMTPGNTGAHLQINGTAAQHCAVKAIGTGHTRITDNGIQGGGRVVATFCDFEKLGGDPDWWGIQFTLNPNGDQYSFVDCTFNECSQIKHNGNYNVTPGGYIEFIRCVWTNSVEKTNLGQWEEWNIFETWSEYGVTAKLIHCDFDLRVALHMPKDYEIEDCVFRDGIHKYTGFWWGGIFKSFKRNLIRWDGNGYVGFEHGTTIEDCVFIMDDPGGWNPHFGHIGDGTGATHIDGCLFWFTGTAANSEGDGFFIAGAETGTRADNTVTFEKNIFLPNGNGPNGNNNTSCTGFTILFESYNKQVVFKRNTLFTGSGTGGLSLGEGNPSTAGDVNYVKSNLFVGGSNGNGMKINNYGLSQTDVFLADSVNYNGGFQLQDGNMFGNGSGKGYDDFTFSGSNVVGPNDLDDTDPQFFDDTRTPATWAGDLTTAMNQLSPGGGSVMQDLLTYIRDGFRPQNSAFQGAGDPNDGSPDIGAVDITTVANIPPTVNITYPNDGDVFTVPVNITITANASDSDGSVTLVEFFEGANKLGEDSSAPYSFTWNSVPGGSYSLTAVATDNDGDKTTSSAVNIIVNDPSATLLVNDFGDDDDFNTNSQIYFERFGWETNYNIPGDDADFINQETVDSFWVFTDAPNYSDLIKARTIVMTTNAEFFTTAIGTGSTVHLGIRYKDNVPTYAGGAPVYAHNGSYWVEIGTLGGAFDHQWKVEVIAVSPSDLGVSNGLYRFRIGEGLWSLGLKNFMSIDRIELATTAAQLTVEPPTPGYNPAAGDGNFPGMDKDSPWLDESGNPFFPIGFGAGWTGMSPALFQQVADGGFNTLVFYNWMDIGDPYAAGDVWDVLPSPGHFGFTEFLDECEAKGLKAIGVFQNDIKHTVVADYFGSEKACLDYIKSSIEKNKDHPALLAWSPVDEPDHSYIPEFYAPLEWVMSVKNTIRDADPDHPIYALEIGWRQGAFGHYRDIADFQGYDVYPEFGDNIEMIGIRADQLVDETLGEKPFIAYLKAYDRTAAQAYMSMAEAYLALIHGANGIFYWDLGHADPIWSTLTQIADEIDSLNHVLLPPATFLDVNGSNGLCSDNSSQIENAYKEGSDGKKYILSSNLENFSDNNVQFTVSGLQAGTVITVLFENRTITAQAGYFEDDFGAYERHVYDLGNLSPGLSLTTSSTPVSCPGGSDGSATVTATGGTTPYTYLWSNGGTTATISSLSVGTYTVTVTDNDGITATASETVTEPAAIVITTTTTPASCGANNGSASANASGGTSPYNYLWSTGATTQSIFNLAPGTYTVSVTDSNNCTQSEIAVVTALGGFTVTTSGVNVSCFGGMDGEATAFPSGGSGNYSFEWSNFEYSQTITNLSAGTYSVTVTDDDTGCTAIASQVITEPAEMIVTTTTSPASCGINNGSASASVTGGNSPYTYAWSNGGNTQTISSLSAGTYTVTVTDSNSCTETENAVVSAINGISASTSGINISCFGAMDGEATAFGSGGSGNYSFEWSNAEFTQTISNLGTGTYDVTVTDDDTGCTATAAQVIIEPAALSLTIVGMDAQNGNDGSADLTVMGGTSPYSYLWSNGETTEDIDGLAPGTYTVTVTDANACTETESVVIGGGGGCNWTVLNSEDFEAGWGIWNDGGSDCRRSINDAAYAYSGSYCIRLRDNDPNSSYMTTNTQDLSSYNDIKVEFTYITRSFDNANEDFFLEISSDGGNSFTQIEEWNLNDEFVNDVREFENITIAGPFTTTTQLRFRCDASGNSDWVYFDDVIISGCSSGIPQYTLTTTVAGQGSIDPSGGTYNAGTQVTLTATPDTGWQFDNWSGDASGSSNPVTITMDANKTVTANFSPTGGGCSYYDIDDEGFETGWGIWNDGGSDCRRNINDAAYASSGSYCIRLRDNDPNSSFMTTNNLDLATYDELTIDFGYYVRSFDNADEDFWLQISTDGGVNFTTVEEWNLGDEFNNDEFKTGMAVITGPFTVNTQLRFRCDASGNSDWVYIDDVVIIGCSSNSQIVIKDQKSLVKFQRAEIVGERAAEVETMENEESLEMNLFPNPASDQLTISYESPNSEIVEIVLSDFSGRIIRQYQKSGGSNQIVVDLRNVQDGYYLVQMMTGGERIAKKFVVVK